MMIRMWLGTIAGVLLLGISPVRADVVTDWNTIMLTTISSQNPLAQSRYAAITQLAVFEAVNAITGEFKPYLGTVRASRDASPEAAAIAAAYRVLVTYFPASLSTLNAARASSLSTIPNGWAKDAGIAAGEAAANAMITLRAEDGSAPAEFYVPPSFDAGQWQVTPSCPAGGGTLLQWRNVTPFGIKSADQFRSDPPPALTSNRYTRSFNEVKTVGGVEQSTERPQDRADVAQLYAAVTAPVVWNGVASQILASRHASLPEKARAFALVNMALGDAGVAVFDTKYHYAFWRPETAIQHADIDDNPRTDADPSFVPFITTPCFPSYPSAHGTLSNAARVVLERLYGRHHAITISSAALGITFTYQTLREITDDIADARVYGGIHFRFDQEEGAEQGRHVGGYIYRHYLERRHDQEDGRP